MYIEFPPTMCYLKLAIDSCHLPIYSVDGVDDKMGNWA